MLHECRLTSFGICSAELEGVLGCTMGREADFPIFAHQGVVAEHSRMTRARGVVEGQMQRRAIVEEPVSFVVFATMATSPNDSEEHTFLL